ncbi:ribonuclease E inhibitor RraB [Saccharobesus litoralis]|uniref:Ribonuclease E inhibitor RraB n=1 Tax=Saccharobesus litoralis TaxID=2172099 RepID=A0A2S0VMG6_9ALTE|nr:ribonuclease E inhibitor RraB [Saccharobesus litoralis]AWB65414.1 ribonuclease E inhibitor RraB [Saccharobesus litoralis]
MEFHDNPLAFNKFVVESLLKDGSDPDATYVIEHHFSSEDFDLLEKAAVAAYKKGFEATDAEEFITDDDIEILSFDVIAEAPLNVEAINAQTKQMAELAKEFGVEYDGWGTEFIDPDDDGEYENDEYDEYEDK